ncbi:MAG6450 family protein [Alicyclobacillus fodiniaquatilis]|uniref:MAG6450 family protein n=1 Tax=Alicyclobacillus fodiniaquatilis TaxID=1661150 RepID=A0ABW4JI22_9BACL
MPSKKAKQKKLSKKITEINDIANKDIPRSVTDVHKGSTDHLYPTFAFDFVDENKFCLWDADKNYHRGLVATWKKMRSLSWSEIKNHTGLRMKRIETKHTLPTNVSEDIELLEIRVSLEGRLHGFRIDELFQVLWFDPEHEVCPEGKVRR